MQTEIIIQHIYGIHARPSAKIVKIASKYNSDIFIEKDGAKVSAKNIMGLMTLEAHYKEKIKIIANGEDAQLALDDLTTLFNNKFDCEE